MQFHDYIILSFNSQFTSKTIGGTLNFRQRTNEILDYPQQNKYDKNITNFLSQSDYSLENFILHKYNRNSKSFFLNIGTFYLTNVNGIEDVTNLSSATSVTLNLIVFVRDFQKIWVDLNFFWYMKLSWVTFISF